VKRAGKYGAHDAGPGIEDLRVVAEAEPELDVLVQPPVRDLLRASVTRRSPHINIHIYMYLERDHVARERDWDQ
jgi:hypothetical protein